MHSLAQCAAAPRATAPAMRALRWRSRRSVRPGVGVLAPGRRGVPGHRRALLDRDEHVGQRVLHRLELADGPAELDAHLGVLRCRVQAPAGDAGALGCGQRQGQAAHVLVGHHDLLARRHGERPSPPMVSCPTHGWRRRPGGPRRRPRHRAPPGRAGASRCRCRSRAAPGPGGRWAAPAPGARCRASESGPVLGRLPRLGRRAQGHGGGDGAVGQTRAAIPAARRPAPGPRARAAETSSVGSSGPGKRAWPSSSSTTASSARVKPCPPCSSGRWRPSQPWAAIFSQAGAGPPNPSGASATARGTVGGQCVWPSAARWPAETRGPP